MADDSKRKARLSAEFDATGAKKGFEEVKTGAKDMAQAVAKAGQDAAKGVDALGTASGNA